MVFILTADFQGRAAGDDPYKPLQDRCKQKLSKYQRVTNANQSGLQLYISVVFSHTHTGQIHDVVKAFIKDQIRLQLQSVEVFTEGEAKSF